MTIRSVGFQESLDTIVRLENTLKLERLKSEALLKEKRLLDQQLGKQEKDITKLSEELEFLKTETGWTRSKSRGVSRYVDPILLMGMEMAT